MICEKCHGRGMVPQSDLFEALAAEMGCGYVVIPCPMCGGYGIVHCCEGEREHPKHPEQKEKSQ